MAARYSPSFAKNIIRRSLRSVVDSHPAEAEIEILWNYFDSKCAYCNRDVGMSAKDAHIDHLDAGVGGGANHISNRVLACADCNEKEKREIPWREVLRKATLPIGVVDERDERIQNWIVLMSAGRIRIQDDVLRQVEEHISIVIKQYDDALETIRHLRDGTSCD